MADCAPGTLTADPRTSTIRIQRIEWDETTSIRPPPCRAKHSGRTSETTGETMTIRPPLAASAGLLAALAVAQSALAADYNTLELTIDPGVLIYDAYGNPSNVSSGSWFAFDIDNDGKVWGYEKVRLVAGDDEFRLGQTTLPGASHPDKPTSGDRGSLTAPTFFLGKTGTFRLELPSVLDFDTGAFDLSGLRFDWGGQPAIFLGERAWQPEDCGSESCQNLVFADGQGWLSYLPAQGGTTPFYTLDYTAKVPDKHPTGLGGMKFSLHLEGCLRGVSCLTPVVVPEGMRAEDLPGCSSNGEVTCIAAIPAPVPEPAPAWLFAPALAAVLGTVRWQRRHG